METTVTAHEEGSSPSPLLERNYKHIHPTHPTREGKVQPLRSFSTVTHLPTYLLEVGKILTGLEMSYSKMEKSVYSYHIR